MANCRAAASETKYRGIMIMMVLLVFGYLASVLRSTLWASLEIQKKKRCHSRDWAKEVVRKMGDGEELTSELGGPK